MSASWQFPGFATQLMVLFACRHQLIDRALSSSTRTLPLQPQRNHLGLLMVPAGADRFREIGNAPATAVGIGRGGAPAVPVQEWAAAVAALYPPAAAAPKQGDGSSGSSAVAVAAAQRLAGDARYAEEEVDAARGQWREAMASFAALSDGEERRAPAGAGAAAGAKSAPLMRQQNSSGKQQAGAASSGGVDISSSGGGGGCISASTAAAATRLAMSRLKRPPPAAAGAGVEGA